MARLLAWLGFLLVIGSLNVLAPNLLWLGRSSVLVENRSGEAARVRLSLADNPDRILDLGSLPAGAQRFQWIYPAGEATLEVDVHDGETWRRHCREYVEQAMYRVEIVVQSPRKVTCRTTLPLFNSLLIIDLLG